MASPLITPKEAARLLGVKPSTLAAWRHLGRYNLPYVRMGRLVRYRLADIEEFIQRRAHLHTGEEAA